MHTLPNLQDRIEVEQLDWYQHWLKRKKREKKERKQKKEKGEKKKRKKHVEL